MKTPCPHGKTCLHCVIEKQHANQPPAPLPRLLLTLTEAATQLGVTEPHLLHLLRTSGLESQIVVNVGRGRKLRPATIDELIHRNTEAGAA